MPVRPSACARSAAMSKVILSIDLGTETGWALRRADLKVESGAESFSPRSREGPGGRFIRFERWLTDLLAAHPDIARVAYERVVQGGPGQTYAAQVYGGFHALLMMACERRNIPHEGFNVSTVKLQFAGHGNASKDDIGDQCRKLGFNPSTHDEADAIAILHVATGTCPLLTMSGTTKGKKKSRPRPTRAAAAADGNPF